MAINQEDNFIAWSCPLCRKATSRDFPKRATSPQAQCRRTVSKGSSLNSRRRGRRSPTNLRNVQYRRERPSGNHPPSVSRQVGAVVGGLFVRVVRAHARIPYIVCVLCLQSFTSWLIVLSFSGLRVKAKALLPSPKKGKLVLARLPT